MPLEGQIRRNEVFYVVIRYMFSVRRSHARDAPRVHNQVEILGRYNMPTFALKFNACAQRTAEVVLAHPSRAK